MRGNINVETIWGDLDPECGGELGKEKMGKKIVKKSGKNCA
jgi:hypothetical protein